MSHASVPVDVHTISAGKFRRYQHLSKSHQLLMPRLVASNLGDLFKVVCGFFQSLVMILRFRPDVVFAKGGFVCLPVGMAAKILRVPIVVHDSDTRPGLTNSVLGRWAKAIATGSPLENYSYERAISKYTGVPISVDFRPVSPESRRAGKQQLAVDADWPLIVVTGGGLGSTCINDAVVKVAPKLIAAGASIYHITGKKHYNDVQKISQKNKNYQIVPFIYSDMASILSAADIVISRASATFIQEMAGIGCTAVIVPAHQLGDQRKNAEVYKQAEAAKVLTDDDIAKEDVLYTTLTDLINNPSERRRLADNLHAFARPDAAKDVAQMVFVTSQGRAMHYNKQ